jgi:hypothetical protein
MFGLQTQYGISNQLTRSVIRNVATSLHLHQICAYICWLAAKIISQVGIVPIGKYMWVLE